MSMAAAFFAAFCGRLVFVWAKPGMGIPAIGWVEYAIGVALPLVFACHALRLKHVEMDADNLYVSHHGDTETIPLAQVQSISGGRFLSGSREVRIVFREITAVGLSITFCAPPGGYRIRGEHTDVAELKRLAGIVPEVEDGSPTTPCT